MSDGDTSVPSIIDSLKRFNTSVKGFPELGPPHEDRDLGTALYDAVFYSVKEKLAKPGQRRRAILLFSDGEENSSANDLLDTIEAAQNADTLIYSIRYTQIEHGRLNARNRYGISVMHHLEVRPAAVTSMPFEPTWPLSSIKSAPNSAHSTKSDTCPPVLTLTAPSTR